MENRFRESRRALLNWKGLLYPLLPSWGKTFHAKRRKGFWYRHVPAGTLECQTEQDRIFWETFLHPQVGEFFLEVGAGDGAVGSHTLALERDRHWQGLLWETLPRPRQRAQQHRSSPALSDPPAIGKPPAGLLAIHRPSEFPMIWQDLEQGKLRPAWVIVENREPDPRWCRLLEGVGYKLSFYFHDDEYFQLRK